MSFSTFVAFLQFLFNYFSTCITYPIWKIFPIPKPRIAFIDSKDPRPTYKRVDSRFTTHYAFQATTIPELVALTFENNEPEKPALGYRKVLSKCLSKNGDVNLELSDYSWLTLAQVRETVAKLALGFASHGVTFQEQVLIYAETSPEWFLCAQALWRIGATVATIFANLGTEGIIHGITETEVEKIITTGDLLPGLLAIIGQLPKVRQIYVLEQHRKVLPVQVEQSDFTKVSPVKLIFYETLLENGKEVSSEQMEAQSPSANDIAVVMYTSGSTGQPKGVLLTHGNLVTGCQAIYSSFEDRLMDRSSCDQTYYAFLPLAHVFELVAEIGAFGAGWAIGYGSVTTIVDHSPGLSPGTAGDLTLLRPTIMCAVPLLIERIRMKLSARVGKSVAKQSLARTIIKYKNFWRYFGVDTPVVNRVFCEKAQASLGGRVRTMLVAGAHLSVETQEIIQNLFNIRILVAFGATETCASFISDYDDTSFGTTSLLHGNQFRLIDWQAGGYLVSDRPNPRGELLIGGPSVALGYLGKLQMTVEAFEVDTHGTRWFKTGDIAEVLPGNRIQIIDRKKDLVKMANGEFVSLGKAETALRCFPLLEHVALFSSVRHNYLVALFAVNETALRELAAQMLTDEQVAGSSVKGLCQSESLQLAVHQELRAFCKVNSLPARVIPRHFKLCADKWTVASGLLTGSLKINRVKIATFYRDTIQELFEL